ncbi:hypothetical protein QUA82_11285 [Microcoleus sp. F8-D3]
MINFRGYRSFIEVYRPGTVSGPRKSSNSRNRLLANTSQQESQLWEIPCFKGLRGGWFPRKRDKYCILKLLDTQISGAIEKLASVPRKNSTAQTPQTLRIGTPKKIFTK